MNAKNATNSNNSSNSKLDLIRHLQEFFKENGHRFNLELVFLYGSWAGGHPHQASDIDLAVIFNNKELPEEETFNRIINLELELSEMMNREVNILLIYEDFRKPLLYYNAIVLGILLYAKDYDNYFFLKNEALFQMEDYSIFGIPWQMEMADKKLGELTRA